MRRDRVTTPIVLEELTRRALGGDREALDMLVRALQGDVYGLALRMLWNHEVGLIRVGGGINYAA
jgi:hypothetical protein